MAKNDLLRRNDQRPVTANGELVPVASVVQISHLTVAGPYSGDFQITNGGRLIVGDDPDSGARVIISNSGQFGYSSSGTQTFSLYTATAGSHAPGDLHLGNLAANYLFYSQANGTLGLYTPQGAGFIAQRDGTLQAGLASGAHMLWNAADEALQVRYGSDVKINLGADGNASFDGTIYASGGRIYGLMVVDDVLRAGDVDGPAVYLGKFVREATGGDTIETAEIIATDEKNLPWFHVVAGGETLPGYFHLGGTGDYDQHLSYDGTTLELDGTIRARDGVIGGWTIGATALTSTDNGVALNSAGSIVFGGGNKLDSEGLKLLTGATSAASFSNSVSWVDRAALTVPIARMYAYQETNNFLNIEVSEDTAGASTTPFLTISSFTTDALGAQTKMQAYGTTKAASVLAEIAPAGNSAVRIVADLFTVASVTKLGDGGSTNYAQFSATGNLTFHGSATATIPLSFPVVTKTADYVATAADTVIVCNKATAMTITLPAATGSGKWYAISSIGAGAVTIDGNASETINDATTQVLGQFDTAQIVDYASGKWVVI